MKIRVVAEYEIDEPERLIGIAIGERARHSIGTEEEGWMEMDAGQAFMEVWGFFMTDTGIFEGTEWDNTVQQAHKHMFKPLDRWVDEVTDE